MKLIYLFDPLCGWCYAGSPAALQLAKAAGVELAVYATGLFAESGRVMNAAFAQHAWANDQRIAQLTGQPFSEQYHQQILLGNGEFNSRALSEMCAALLPQGSEKMLTLLAAMQHARYVEGKDTSKRSVLQEILQELDEDAVAAQLGDKRLATLTDEWLANGQAIAQQFQASGVPSLFAETDKGWVNVPSQLLYQNAESAVENIKVFFGKNEKLS